MEQYRLLIGGKLVESASQLEVINPATGQLFANCPRASEAQLNQAVAAAKAAFPEWASRTIEARRALLMQLADRLESQREVMARLLTEEQGKPLAEAHWELAFSSGAIRALATMDLPVETIRESAEARILRQYTPLGVVAAITPWNSPLLLLMIKLAPALLVGNTMVIKPAPTTPLTTLRFGEMCADILPAGVVNVITDDNDLGDALTRHPDVAKVAFTGSTATGRKVMASAASTLKRLTVELGGNDAAIVLEDVDPKEVAPKIFGAAMMNCGQVCFAVKRVYAHQAIYDALCQELAALANSAIVDEGTKPGATIGPIQNKRQFDKLKRLLEDSRKQGKIIAGGEVLDRPGYFMRPTIVRDIPDHARLVREEQFGPILPVLRFTDIDDAINRANDTEYGLSATVWSGDEKRATAVAMKLQAGTVWINKHLDLPPDIPVQGAKQSGFGSELGEEGLKEFTQAKVINVAKHA